MRFEVLKTWLMAAWAVLALTLGLVQTVWLIGMIHQWAIPWSSLQILAHPR